MKKLKIALFVSFVIAINFIFAVKAQAANPVLNFSDLIEGPKAGIGDGLGSGAIVTIWGVGLGTSQGTSKVYVGSVEAAYVYEWGNATAQTGHPADLYTYHKMQRISFSIPAAAIDGANTIKVVVGGVDSNTLPFTVRIGNIRHVKTNGADNTSCGNWSAPCRTVTYAIANRVTAGDTIYAGNGVSDSGAYPYLFHGTTGTSGNYIFISAYPGAAVTAIASGECVANYNGANNYIGISKITCKSDGSGMGPFGYLRSIANEITDNTCADGQSGVFYGAYDNVNSIRSDGIKIIGNYIHDFGGSCTTGLHHVIYASYRCFGCSAFQKDAVAWEIGWNYLTDNQARAGIHYYDEGACQGWAGITKVHDNVVKNQVGPAMDINSGCASGWRLAIDVNVYNNLFINTGAANLAGGEATEAISIKCCCGDTAARNCANGTAKFYNNTFYGYSQNCTPPECGTLGIYNQLPQASMNTTLDIHWVNNIAYGLYNQPYWYNFGDNGNNPITHSNNLWYNGGDGNPASPPSWDISPLTPNPLFVNAASNDFTLSASSPAINAGTNLYSLIKYDLQGNPRPSSGAFSLGAIEYASGGTPPDTTPPSSPTGVTVI